MGTSHGDFTKYPRTPHLFGSKGTDDDKHLGEAESKEFIADESLIVEEKIDGSPKHAVKGEHVARAVLRDLGCDLKTREEIARLVRYHGRPAFLLEREEPTHEVVRLSWLVNNRLLYLFALADTRGRDTDSMTRPEEIRPTIRDEWHRRPKNAVGSVSGQEPRSPSMPPTRCGRLVAGGSICLPTTTPVSRSSTSNLRLTRCCDKTRHGTRLYPSR